MLHTAGLGERLKVKPLVPNWVGMSVVNPGWRGGGGRFSNSELLKPRGVAMWSWRNAAYFSAVCVIFIKLKYCTTMSQQLLQIWAHKIQTFFFASLCVNRTA